jgi:formiminoglutamase
MLGEAAKAARRLRHAVPVTDDPRWPRASAWLAQPPPQGPVDLAVIGVPACRTSLSPTRADTTPSAIRDALQRFSVATTRGGDLGALTVLDAGDLLDPDGDEPGTSAAVGRLASRSRLTVALGGDNSITYAVARGLLGDLAVGGLVTLDAHHDLRTGRSNGSPVRRLIDAGLRPERIVQIGIADFANSPAYSSEARELGITVVDRQQVADQGITAAVAAALDRAGVGGPVHVDIDVDVCDRAVAPACPASLPGGLSAAELIAAARQAGADPRVVGIDIAEVDASRDAPDGRTVRLAALALLAAAGGLLERPR